MIAPIRKLALALAAVAAFPLTLSASVSRDAGATPVSPADAAQAVVLSNYPPTNDTNTTADVDNLRWKALSFMMPVGAGANLGLLTVRLGNYNLATDMPIFEIRDHTGSTTAPGPNILASFVAPPPGPDAAIRDYTFTPSSLFTLQPNTSYWLVARGPDAVSSVDWRGSSPAIQPTGIAVYGGQSLFTTSAGSTWSNSATINSFQLLDIVPEPGTAGAVLAFAIGGVFVRRRG